MSVTHLSHWKARKAATVDSRVLPGLEAALESKEVRQDYSTQMLLEMPSQTIITEIYMMGSCIYSTAKPTRKTGLTWLLATIGGSLTKAKCQIQRLKQMFT